MTHFPFAISFLLQVILETEHDNAPALSLYESLGFIREKRLFRFYMNGKDAFRLVLALPSPSSSASSSPSPSRMMSGRDASEAANALASMTLFARNRDSDSDSEDEVSSR